jgi:bisphosphoglycerate-independent phosphoglycerate mutase (AlkP superfamily)
MVALTPARFEGVNGDLESFRFSGRYFAMTRDERERSCHTRSRL